MIELESWVHVDYLLLNYNEQKHFILDDHFWNLFPLLVMQSVDHLRISFA